MPAISQPELGPIYFWSLWYVCGGSKAFAGAGISPGQAVGREGWPCGIGVAIVLGRKWLQLKFEPWGWCPWIVSALSWSESLAIIRPHPDLATCGASPNKV